MTWGLNCGEGDYPGGYDGYPCQHERFVQQGDGQWINNVTYCSGKDDVCDSEIIVTIAATIVRADCHQTAAATMPAAAGCKQIYHHHHHCHDDETIMNIANIIITLIVNNAIANIK